MASVLKCADLKEYIYKFGIGGKNGYVPLKGGLVLEDFEEQISHHINSLVISPALKVYGGEEQEDAGVGRVLPPELHAVLLGVLVVAGLVLGVRQLGQA